MLVINIYLNGAKRTIHVMCYTYNAILQRYKTDRDGMKKMSRPASAISHLIVILLDDDDVFIVDVDVSFSVDVVDEGTLKVVGLTVLTVEVVRVGLVLSFGVEVD